jgi:hypothetical protein
VLSDGSLGVFIRERGFPSAHSASLSLSLLSLQKLTHPGPDVNVQLSLSAGATVLSTAALAAPPRFNMQPIESYVLASLTTVALCAVRCMCVRVCAFVCVLVCVCVCVCACVFPGLPLALDPHRPRRGSPSVLSPAARRRVAA